MTSQERQHSLDFNPHPPSSGPATSGAAAHAIKPHSPTLRDQVFAAINAGGPDGITDAEGQALTELSGDTYRPRRWELTRARLIKRTGQTRETPSGRRADCWAVT